VGEGRNVRRRTGEYSDEAISGSMGGGLIEGEDFDAL
jgi:hypothetical protein